MGLSVPQVHLGTFYMSHLNLALSLTRLIHQEKNLALWYVINVMVLSKYVDKTATDRFIVAYTVNMSNGRLLQKLFQFKNFAFRTPQNQC